MIGEICLGFCWSSFIWREVWLMAWEDGGTWKIARIWQLDKTRPALGCRQGSPNWNTTATSWSLIKSVFSHKGSCTYYVIMDRGGGLSKWLQYYIGVVWQIITVYPESWVVTLGIIFPKTWQKNIFFSVGKKSFLGVMSKRLQLYIGGVRPNDYSIT